MTPERDLCPVIRLPRRPRGPARLGAAAPVILIWGWVAAHRPERMPKTGTKAGDRLVYHLLNYGKDKVTLRIRPVYPD
jgi:hypothetical protein